jgi:hypothetical protein
MAFEGRTQGNRGPPGGGGRAAKSRDPGRQLCYHEREVPRMIGPMEIIVIVVVVIVIVGYARVSRRKDKD